MLDFVKPRLLGSRKEFSNRFVNPITNGQASDATLRDVKLMKKRAHILHETLAGCVQVGCLGLNYQYITVVISVSSTIQGPLYSVIMPISEKGLHSADQIFDAKARVRNFCETVPSPDQAV